MYLLPLWVHCSEYSETGEFVFLCSKFDLLRQSWAAWVRRNEVFGCFDAVIVDYFLSETPSSSPHFGWFAA